MIGKLRKLNAQQQYEHDLAAARQQFHFSAVRQSRHSLWCDFPSRLMEAVKTKQTEENADEPEMPLKEVKTVRPNCADADGHRVFQVVLIRPFQAGDEAGPVRIGSLVLDFLFHCVPFDTV